jgi:hypothetical protein
MKQYCYVIVSTNGTKHWTRIIAGSEASMESNWDKENLQRLLATGWRPVRETALGGSSSLPSAFALLVLERDSEPVAMSGSSAAQAIQEAPR